MSSVSVNHGPDQTPLRLRRITADEYFQMVREGIIREGERVELIGGMIVSMSPAERRHNGALFRLTEGLRRIDGAGLAVQLTLTLDDDTVVDPDLALLRPATEPEAGLTPADVLLLVEVADTSLPTDRGAKAERYARAGITDYWIVDVEARRVLVLREPGETGYTSVTEIGLEGEARALHVADAVVRVADLFPGVTNT